MEAALTPETDTVDLPTLPEGDYAIVALFGHNRLVGRITEIERFGAKMIQIEPIYQGALLAPVYHGGAAIYGLTPCTREKAAECGPKHLYQLPIEVRSVLPPELLPPPRPSFDDRDGDPDLIDIEVEPDPDGEPF